MNKIAIATPNSNSNPSLDLSHIGVVAIGRNEGDRLRICINSIAARGLKAIYVDSGSTDGSVELISSIRMELFQLDPPYSAARARNAGVTALAAIYPELEFVQLIDGDCEFIDGWFEAALAAFETYPDAVLICGKLQERHPEASIYNRLCALEWDVPIGEARECGGIALIRLAAFQACGGFNPDLIAGEEPEFCIRLRQNNGKIYRIADPMAWHDADLMHFSQWWSRTVRAGYAYAQGAWMNGGPPEWHWLKESLSIWAWGVALPVVTLASAWPTQGLSLLGFGFLNALLASRMYRYQRDRSIPRYDSAIYAGFCTLGKLPQAIGQLRFHGLRIQGKRSVIIEHKNPPNPV